MSLNPRLRSEAGFGLVEVMVTALVVLILASGVLAGLDAASHASGRVKLRSVAMTLAQQDQERLRAMVIGDLANVRASQTRSIPVCSDAANTKGCTSYSVASQADWVGDSQGIESCTTTNADFDYLKITSTVTWPNMDVKPVVTESLLTPRVGDIGKNTGNLAVKVLRADGITGVPNVRVTLTGPENYTDLTNGAGCVVWGALPSGNGYTVAINEPGFVGVNGNQAVTKTAGVLADSLTTTSLLYDGAAAADISFTTVANGKTYTGQASDTVSLVQNQMLPVTRTFGTSGTSATTIAATSLFPFKSASQGGQYVVFAGDCDGENPAKQTPPETTGNLKTLGDLAPGSGTAYALQIPSIDFQVLTRDTTVATDPKTVGSAATAAKTEFVETTTGCVNSGSAVVPSVAVQPATGQDPGHPQDPGVRYGNWAVCAEANVGSPAKLRHEAVANVTVNQLAGVTVTGADGIAGKILIDPSDPLNGC